MAVGLSAALELAPVAGVRLGCARLGGRREPRDDLVVVAADAGTRMAGRFTRNAFCAAPVSVARQHLGAGTPRYLLVNAGNANAGTGEQGIDDARRCCGALADRVGGSPEEVLPFSTGVIGEPLAVERFPEAIDAAVQNLSADGWADAARAIMTTDTVPKGASRRLTVDGREAVVTGIAKGAGMIRPHMATMLAFIATDADVSQAVLDGCLGKAVRGSFDRVTVDGDTSTNDACVLLATGKAGNATVEDPESEQARVFYDALFEVCLHLAQGLVRDAEGATKFITIQVSEGRDEDECLQVAYTVAHSPLVKTAMFASDANWGRILAAVGRAGLDDLRIDGVHIDLGDVAIVRNGARAPEYLDEHGQRVMSEAEIQVAIRLGRGSSRASVWTSDLSHGYVTINAEYRT